ncbi:hypothetical protein AB0J86_34560 [Micromonospora sp. NPDC049559]|uniref:hypothetical protein n=1 Tax=Micromonospora sp. NPDC049559 TaxID=3155923 RepID=UPI003418120D
MSRPDRAPEEPTAADRTEVAGPSGTGDRPGGGTGDGPGGTGAPVEEIGRSGADDGRLGATVAALAEDEIDTARRRHLLGRLVGELRTRGVGDLFKPRAAIRWLTDVVGDIAPRIPIRDQETLRRHLGGLEGDALAERLVRNAARATAGVGAAGGGLAAVEWTVTPTLLSAPILLAAETVAVVTIELKLIGELHEAYGVPLPGTGTQRAVALIHAWATRRGINPLTPGVGVAAVLGTAARRELRETLLRRFGRNLTTLGPFLTGAAVASFLNRRATRGLGDAIRDDLRRQQRKMISAGPA